MALFTDSNISTLEDLQQYDSAVLDVAKTEGISLTGKMSLAEQELALELQAFLMRGSAAGQGGYDLSHVVATPAIRQWHTLKTLSLVYGDVYNSQLNDRYLGKWNLYLRLARQTAQLLLQTGVGVVQNPVPRARQPKLAAGTALGTPGVWMVSIVWRNTFGEQGAPSDPVTFESLEGALPQVTPPDPPAGSYAYDVYLGPSADGLVKQNDIPVGSATAWEPAAWNPDGPAPGTGQLAETFVRLERILQRG